jgi:hypothetical protein
MHAPSLHTNLISVPRADHCRLSVAGKDGELELWNNKGDIVIVGSHRKSALYKVQIEPLDPGRFPSRPTAFVSIDPRKLATSNSKASLELWHRRLGHLNDVAVQSLTQSKVLGMEICGQQNDGICVDCLKGKQQRHKFHNSQKESDVLKRVYVDLMGPMSVPAINGEIYVLTADDGGSSFYHVVLLKSKAAEETVKWLKCFHKMAERQTGRPLKCIRTDNGTEFCNSLWKEYLEQEGIAHELTTPYTPQQNGLSERGHHTLANAARTMMFDACAPTSLWEEAFKTAAYLLNVCPSRHQEGKTPYEIWFQRKPNISHLRVWGSKAYAKVPDQLRTKLDEKSIESTLVGYTGDANYIIYIAGGMGKLIRSRDIIFNEGTGAHSAYIPVPNGKPGGKILT